MDHIEIEKEKWDEEYINGTWDYLSQSDEAARYSIIIGYIRRYAPKGNILDLGCGVGELWNWLTEDERKRYLGVDISTEAVRFAKRKNVECFCEGDIATFKPSHKYDIIVLNEVLYYIPNPLEIIQNCFCYLTENGTIVISMFIYPDKRDGEYKIVERIIQQIKKNNVYNISDIVSLTNKYKWKRTWSILTLKIKNEVPRKFVLEKVFESHFRSCKVDAGDFEAITGEEFYLKLKSNEHLYCLFFQKENSRGTIIISHGYIKEIPYLRHFKLFYDEGFSVFIYDMRGFGKSYGNKTSFGFYEQYDLSECIDWVKKRCGNKEIIGLYGDEIGAAASILNMCDDNRTEFGIFENVFSDLQSYISKEKGIYAYIKYFTENIHNRIDNGFWYGQISPLSEVATIERPIMLLDNMKGNKEKQIKDFINSI